MYVYWIHREVHKDIWTQGYVGVTKRSIQKRLSDHRNQRNPRLSAALKKYNDITVDCIFEGTDVECLSYELLLRQHKLTGWNLVPGGGLPPNRTGRNHTIKSKELMKLNSKGKNLGKVPWNKGLTKHDDSRLAVHGQKVSLNHSSKKLGFISPFKNKVPAKLECPHCNSLVDYRNAGRWHFDKCKKYKEAA